MQIDFYHLPGGRSPINDFLGGLSDKAHMKALWTLETIQSLYPKPNAYLEKLSNAGELWEVKVQQGNNIYRLLGFFKTPDELMLVHAFVKKTQKTPPREIDLALQRKKEYNERKKNGHQNQESG